VGIVTFVGFFLNTTSQTKAVDSVPGGAVTMNYFDQFNNRPNNMFRRVLKIAFTFNSAVCQIFNYYQFSQCASMGNPAFRPDTPAFAIWLELTGVFSSPTACGFWIGNCPLSCNDRSYSMNLCENPLFPGGETCNDLEGLEGGRPFTFSSDCQFLTFTPPPPSDDDFSSFDNLSDESELENPVYKRQTKAISPP
jgi:hypothetical protein